MSGLLTLIAMAAIVVGVPAWWITERVVDSEGFAATIAPVAASSSVKEFMADEITTGVTDNSGGVLQESAVSAVATVYTNSPQFADDFVTIATAQHDWLFDEPSAGSESGVMHLDITDVVNRVLQQQGIPVAAAGPVTVPIGNGGGTNLEAGRYHQTGQDITRLAYGASVIAVIAGLAALLIARRRGTVLAWLGVSGIAAAATLWVVGVLLDQRAQQEIDGAQGSGRQTADLVIDGLVSDAHHVALIAGGVGAGVLILGVIVRAMSR